MGRGRVEYAYGRGLAVTGPGEAEIVRRVWAGESWEAVAVGLSVAVRSVARAMRDSGGMPPRWTERSPLRLSLEEREEISLGLQAGESLQSIARRLGRSVSTISVEVAVHGGAKAFRAAAADRAAYEAARRPKPAKFVTCPRLRDYVEAKLAEEEWSPEQISARLKLDFPGDEEMRVSPETIYKALYVYPKGGLRKTWSKRCAAVGPAPAAQPHDGGEAGPDHQHGDDLGTSQRGR